MRDISNHKEMNPQVQAELSSEANKENLLKARLSDTEQGFLFQFAQNQGLVHAVEKALLYSMYQMGTVQKSDRDIMDVNWAYIPHNSTVTDEMLGRELRAKIAGLSMLYDAFKQIKKFNQPVLEIEKEVNSAV